METFKPFLTKDEKRFVVDQRIEVTNLAMRVINAGSINRIADDNNILLDAYHVVTEEHEKRWLAELKEINKIPAHYVVRTLAPNHRFVCGFDLLNDVFKDNPRYWVGLETRGTHVFDTMSDALAYLEKEIKEPFNISLEEPLPL